MSAVNAESTFVRIIKEICAENNIVYKTYSYNWVFELKKDNLTRYILGYQLDLNTAAVHAICKDKSAATDIMVSNGIPCVEHTFFLSPSNIGYLGIDGSWPAIKKLKDTYSKIVCKPNDGTGGKDVFVVSTQKELEYAVDKIFSHSRSMAICPYHDIKEEYRVIILNNQVKLIFSKQRPFITGDGYSTLAALLCEYIEANKLDTFKIDLEGQSYQTILKKGEIFTFSWKHNLGLGAKALVLEDESIIEQITPLALKAAKTLSLKFASVDIIQTENTYKILEINSGVMMEHFSSQNGEYYNLTKKIYKEAINLMFE